MIILGRGHLYVKTQTYEHTVAPSTQFISKIPKYLNFDEIRTADSEMMIDCGARHASISMKLQGTPSESFVVYLVIIIEHIDHIRKRVDESE